MASNREYLKRRRLLEKGLHNMLLDSSDSKSDNSDNEQLHCFINEDRGSSVGVNNNNITSDFDDYIYDHFPEESDIDDCFENVGTFENSSENDDDTTVEANFAITEESNKLQSELENWACETTIARTGLNKLLAILRNNGHSDLPVDARTLLHFPRHIEYENCFGGQFINFGIKEELTSFLITNKPIARIITLLFNIDGLPLFNSSCMQLWPILCIAEVNCMRSKPFIVSLFCGVSKPSSLDEYLNKFLVELEDLRCNGIEVNNNHFTVCKVLFVCDAPARSRLKCIKPHNGYNSCERCVARGTYERGRVVFTELNAELRTDDKFARLKYVHSGHQAKAAKSPLTNTKLQISLVSCFILDYMHLVCLGVVRRLLYFLISGPKTVKLSRNSIDRISEELISFKDFVPSDFARKPRGLKDFSRWKATELRQFLIYTGPVVLKKYLNKELYENFLCLSIGISILMSTTNTESVEYARPLLTLFVKNSRVLYGDAFVVYNVHSLIHLPDDVLKHNCMLDKMSAFPFEIFLFMLKKTVKSPNNPVVQIANRLEHIKIRLENSQTCSVTRLSSNIRDNCYLLANGNICLIASVCNEESVTGSLIDKQYLVDLFTLPCNSSKLNIFKLDKRLYEKARRKKISIKTKNIVKKLST
jgi:hypothetical protein